jgi:ribosomal protein L11 methyltransferase
MVHGMARGQSDDPHDADGATWVLDLALAADVIVPDGCGTGREAFIEWLWATLADDGLAGIFEGAVDVEAAAAAGLVDSPRVLDAAEAPADRDWVAGMPSATLACWFTDEPAARRAAAVAAAAGCDIVSLRRERAAADAASWRDAFAPIAVPGFGVVHPAWGGGAPRASGDESTIFIEPGAGFGTGLHETTQLCLAAIAGLTGQGRRLDRVLDFGAGSGILAIAAAVLGAAHVDAVEVDPRVHAAIRGNADRNGVADRVVVSGSLPAAAPSYDLVVANIVADVLVAHAPHLAAAVRHDPRGGLVLSGLLDDDVTRVAAAFTGLLEGPPVVTRRGDWRCLVFAPAATAGERPCP